MSSSSEREWSGPPIAYGMAWRGAKVAGARRRRRRLPRVARQLRAGLAAGQGPRPCRPIRRLTARSVESWSDLAARARGDFRDRCPLRAPRRPGLLSGRGRARGAPHAAVASAQPARRQRTGLGDARAGTTSSASCRASASATGRKRRKPSAARRPRQSAAASCRAAAVLHSERRHAALRPCRCRACCRRATASSSRPARAFCARRASSSRPASRAAISPPQVGLAVPVRPQRGQILVTERLAPLLPLPASGLRQTAKAR